MLRYSLVQQDLRYCVVGHVGGSAQHQETVGWTDDRDMAERILEAITQRWPRYGGGEIKDFKRGT
jgi:hypothetical protein